MKDNIVVSVHQRILNIARSEKKRFNDLLQQYALERWLYRLSISYFSDQFILKGGLMLIAWEIPVNRVTRDIDFLARTDNNLGSVKDIITEISIIQVKNDGLYFDDKSIKTEHISEDADYSGVRVTFIGKLGNSKIPMQIDIGFSDVVTPAEEIIDFPTVLDMPAPRLKSYNRETVVAEKFEAMISLGELNSRMKDFYDIWLLAINYDFDGESLVQAVSNTFERRGTTLSLVSPCFTSGFGVDQTRQKQWKLFVKRSELKEVSEEFMDAWGMVIKLLKPVAIALSQNSSFNYIWKPGVSWKDKK